MTKPEAPGPLRERQVNALGNDFGKVSLIQGTPRASIWKKAGALSTKVGRSELGDSIRLFELMDVPQRRREKLI